SRIRCMAAVHRTLAVHPESKRHSHRDIGARQRMFQSNGCHSPKRCMSVADAVMQFTDKARNAGNVRKTQGRLLSETLHGWDVWLRADRKLSKNSYEPPPGKLWPARAGMLLNSQHG